MKRIATIHCCLLLSALTLLSACRSTPPQDEAVLASGLPIAKEENRHWWYARFRIHWPQGEAPQWAIDPLIADLLIEPVLRFHGHRISLWRFHRRAARDRSGHRFSFIFYTDRITARYIYQAIENDPLLNRLQEAGLVNEFTKDDVDRPRRPAVADVSDSSWSAEVQRTWPVYIMGVSAFWLDLIEQYLPKSDEKRATIADLLQSYQDANAKIDAFWRNEARHSLLHHLNALFGYGAMPIPLELRY